MEKGGRELGRGGGRMGGRAEEKRAKGQRVKRVGGEGEGNRRKGVCVYKVFLPDVTLPNILNSFLIMSWSVVFTGRFS